MVTRSWLGTTGIGITIAVLDIIMWHHFRPNIIMIAPIGIVTFFGMLILSSYHKKYVLGSGDSKDGKDRKDDGDTGTMRDALTGSLITIFFVTLPYVLTLVRDKDDPVIGGFFDIFIILVGFYFGSKAVIQISKGPKNGKSG